MSEIQKVGSVALSGVVYVHKIQPSETLNDKGEVVEKLDANGLIVLKRPSFPELMRMLKECGYQAGGNGVEGVDQMTSMASMIEKIEPYVESVNVSLNGEDITDWQTFMRTGDFFPELGKIATLFSQGFKGGKR